MEIATPPSDAEFLEAMCQKFDAIVKDLKDTPKFTFEEIKRYLIATENIVDKGTGPIMDNFDQKISAGNNNATFTKKNLLNETDEYFCSYKYRTNLMTEVNIFSHELKIKKCSRFDNVTQITNN